MFHFFKPIFENLKILLHEHVLMHSCIILITNMQEQWEDQIISVHSFKKTMNIKIIIINNKINASVGKHRTYRL